MTSMQETIKCTASLNGQQLRDYLRHLNSSIGKGMLIARDISQITNRIADGEGIFFHDNSGEFIAGYLARRLDNEVYYAEALVAKKEYFDIVLDDINRKRRDTYFHVSVNNSDMLDFAENNCQKVTEEPESVHKYAGYRNDGSAILFCLVYDQPGK
ncbi:MAG: hypothetical protein KZQ80_15400 [Candidatus Thiodiazotropha sp. (ex Monitilora ramsayi)]|nr:hypothetical protein [Candidatus Thiodiazotropha sp. (ex Monitilora ramsayi)]